MSCTFDGNIDMAAIAALPPHRRIKVNVAQVVAPDGSVQLVVTPCEVLPDTLAVANKPVSSFPSASTAEIAEQHSSAPAFHSADELPSNDCALTGVYAAASKTLRNRVNNLINDVRVGKSFRKNNTTMADNEDMGVFSDVHVQLSDVILQLVPDTFRLTFLKTLKKFFNVKVDYDNNAKVLTATSNRFDNIQRLHDWLTLSLKDMEKEKRKATKTEAIEQLPPNGRQTVDAVIEEETPAGVVIADDDAQEQETEGMSPPRPRADPRLRPCRRPNYREINEKLESFMNPKPKRGRGRPRKYKKADDTLVNEAAVLKFSDLIVGKVPPLQRNKKPSKATAKAKHIFRFECKLCNFKCQVKKAMQAHRVLHKRGLKCYRCEHCQFDSMSTVALLHHTRRNHSGHLHLCCFCTFSAYSLKLLRAHKRSKHASVPRPTAATEQSEKEQFLFKCKMCPYVGRSARWFQRHLRIHPVGGLEDEAFFRCTQCAYASRNKVRFTKHLQVHDAYAQRNHVCNTCGKAFRRPASLQYHQLLVHVGVTEADKKYGCSVCGKRFVQKGACKTHERLHTAQKCLCTYCGQTLKNAVSYRSHLKTVHLNPEKRFICSHCARAFRTQQQCKNHEKTHLWQRKTPSDGKQTLAKVSAKAAVGLNLLNYLTGNAHAPSITQSSPSAAAAVGAEEAATSLPVTTSTTVAALPLERRDSVEGLDLGFNVEPTDFDCLPRSSDDNMPMFDLPLSPQKALPTVPIKTHERRNKRDKGIVGRPQPIKPLSRQNIDYSAVATKSLDLNLNLDAVDDTLLNDSSGIMSLLDTDLNMKFEL